MKNAFKTNCYLFSLCLLLIACKKDDYSLPPETQTGAGTFGCKIDGKVWVPKGTDYATGQNIIAFYQHIYPSLEGYVFSISATNYESDVIESISITSDSIRLTEGMILPLKLRRIGLNGSARFAQYYDQILYYRTNDVIVGELKLTKFDESSLIVSGTFWFDAIQPNGEVIHITEGRFDKKFTR